MKILALDTSMAACSAAVLTAGESPARSARRWERLERGHAETIVPMIQQVMAEARVAYRELDRIAVTTGPGTFTGVRVGVATGRGLALAAGVPLVGVTSHAVMARQVVTSNDSLTDAAIVAIAVDARRGQIYLSLFDGAGNATSEPRALTPDAGAETLPQAPVVAAGSGARLLADAAERGHARVRVVLSDLQPDAAALAEIAASREPAVDPVRPLYVRPPDAKPQSGAAIPRCA